jgi:hypothetical protein
MQPAPNPARPPVERIKWTTLHSWVKVFRAQVRLRRVNHQTDLATVVKGGDYSVVGTSHSYNGLQLVDRSLAVHFGQSDPRRKSKLYTIEFDEATGEVEVGPTVRVRQLKQFLARRGRQLVNSGSHMSQTVIGAFVTGTHGYGKDATLADSVTRLVFLNGAGEEVQLIRADEDFPYVAVSFGVIAPIIRLRLATVPARQYRVTACTCRLSGKDKFAQGADAVGYALFPYTTPQDPVIALVAFRETQERLEPTRAPKAWPFFKSWGSAFLRHYWLFDRLVPSWRPWFQKKIEQWAVGMSREYVTAPDDLDYLYDPYPAVAGTRPPEILQELFDPAYTGYEVAFFAPLEQTEAVLRYLVEVAQDLRANNHFYLKAIIGVRELSTPSGLVFAGNHAGPVSSIDIYADLSSYAWLREIQNRVVKQFPAVRPHWAKSFITPSFQDSVGRANVDKLRELYLKYYPMRNLRLSYEIEQFLDLAPRPAPPP